MNDETLNDLKSRELKYYFEKEDLEAYFRLIKKYGVPKNEIEEENLWCKAEKNVEKRKKTIQLINELIYPDKILLKIKNENRKV